MKKGGGREHTHTHARIHTNYCVRERGCEGVSHTWERERRGNGKYGAKGRALMYRRGECAALACNAPIRILECVFSNK